MKRPLHGPKQNSTVRSRSHAAPHVRSTARLSLSHDLIQRIQIDPNSLTPADVMVLQRTVGNRAVQQILASRLNQRPSSKPKMRAPMIQTQLEVGSTTDRFEAEADRVARQVVSQPHVAQSGFFTSSSHPNQRMRSAEERLPSAQQSAVGGEALGQAPEIVQRAQPGRIHRCPLADSKEDTSSGSSAPTSSTASPAPQESKPQKSTGSDRAHTSPTKKPSTSAPRVSGQGVITDTQLAAMIKINNSNLSISSKSRANDLIENPDAIDQTAFGICGLVAVLRAVLRSNPVRFAEMAIAAMSDKELLKEWMPVFHKNASEAHIKLGADLDFIVSQWLVRKSAKGSVSQKILTLGTKTEEKSKTKQYTDVYSAQKDFSNKFEIEGWEKEKGHFAMTTGGLNYLLNTIGGGKESFKIKVTDFRRDYIVAKTRAGKTGSVIASVTNTKFYRNMGLPVDTGPKDKPKTKYVHFVMIEDVKEDKDYFHLKLWTWAAYYYAKVRKDVIAQHIPNLIAAETE